MLFLYQEKAASSLAVQVFGMCYKTPVAQQGIWSRPNSCKYLAHFRPLHSLKTRRNLQLLMEMLDQLCKTLGFWGLGSKVHVLGFCPPKSQGHLPSPFVPWAWYKTSAERNSTFCQTFLLQWLTQPALWFCPLALGHLKVTWNAHRGQSSFYLSSWLSE